VQPDWQGRWQYHEDNAQAGMAQGNEIVQLQRLTRTGLSAAAAGNTSPAMPWWAEAAKYSASVEFDDDVQDIQTTLCGVLSWSQVCRSFGP